MILSPTDGALKMRPQLITRHLSPQLFPCSNHHVIVRPQRIQLQKLFETYVLHVPAYPLDACAVKERSICIEFGLASYKTL